MNHYHHRYLMSRHHLMVDYGNEKGEKQTSFLMKMQQRQQQQQQQPTMDE
jgi:hypothetical protein